MACQNKLTRYHLCEGIFSVVRIFPFFVAQYLPRKALLNHHHLHLRQRRPFWSCAGAEVFVIAVFTKSHAPLRWNVIQCHSRPQCLRVWECARKLALDLSPLHAQKSSGSRLNTVFISSLCYHLFFCFKFLSITTSTVFVFNVHLLS